MPVRITATLLQYGEDSSPDGWGDVVQFAPGSLYMDNGQMPALLVQHVDGRTAAGVAEDVWTESDGVTVRAVFRTLENDAGRALESELAAGVRTDVSVGVYVDPDGYTFAPIDPTEEPSWGTAYRMTVTSADLAETSACLRGRFASAHVENVEPVDDAAPATEGESHV